MAPIYAKGSALATDIAPRPPLVPTHAIAAGDDDRRQHPFVRDGKPSESPGMSRPCYRSARWSLNGDANDPTQNAPMKCSIEGCPANTKQKALCARYVIVGK
jgi:hypothetical protein